MPPSAARAMAQDVADGTHCAATVKDAVRMHRFLDAASQTSETGQRAELG